MSHVTRSGKLFKPRWCQDTEQDSVWGEESDSLLNILPHVDHDTLLNSRLVCKAWRHVFSTAVQAISLKQSMSVSTAKALSHKAATAFSSITTLQLQLYQDANKAPAWDLTCDDSGDGAVVRVEDAGLERPAAAATLLRAFSKLLRLQELQLVILRVPYISCCSSLSKLLPLLPQLKVLNLAGCDHESSDLLVIAQHLPALQELVLNCPAAAITSGRKLGPALLPPTDSGLWSYGCLMMEGTGKAFRRDAAGAHYQPEHLAALTALPHLRVLEFTLPDGTPDAEKVACIRAIARLTTLQTLHIHQGHAVCNAMPIQAVDCLSSLTALTQLKMGAGGCTRGSHQLPEAGEAAKHWRAAFAGMQQLQCLKLNHVLLCDAMLFVIGTLPALQHLVLELQVFLVHLLQQQEHSQ